MDDIRVIYLDLPPTVKGMVVKTFDDGDYYTICLNVNISVEEQMKAYRHEVEHILGADFDGADADEIEMERHICL